MPFVKGQPNPSTGRKPGSKNRVTTSVREQLDHANCNPVNVIMRIMRNKRTEDALKLRCADTLLRYLHPQLRSIELKGPGGGPIPIADVSARELFRRRITELASRRAAGSDDLGNDGGAST